MDNLAVGPHGDRKRRRLNLNRILIGSPAVGPDRKPRIETSRVQLPSSEQVGDCVLPSAWHTFCMIYMSAVSLMCCILQTHCHG